MRTEAQPEAERGLLCGHAAMLRRAFPNGSGRRAQPYGWLVQRLDDQAASDARPCGMQHPASLDGCRSAFLCSIAQGTLWRLEASALLELQERVLPGGGRTVTFTQIEGDFKVH